MNQYQLFCLQSTLFPLLTGRDRIRYWPHFYLFVSKNIRHLNIKPSVGGVFTGHPNSSLVFFSPFCVDRSSVFSVLLVDHCLSCSCLLVYCLSFNLWLLITPLVSSDYPFGIFWLPFWYFLITPLVSSDYPFGIFWLPLWYLLITPLVSSDYPFGIFWLPLWYLQTFLIPSFRQIGHKWHLLFFKCVNLRQINCTLVKSYRQCFEP